MIKFLFTFFILPILSLIVPVDKKRFVFGGWFGKRFDDSPKAYILHLLNNKKDFDLVWIYKAGFDIPENLVGKIKFLRSGTLKAFYYQITAGVVFVTHGINADLDRCFVSHRSVRIQFWHGIPIKKIRFDSTKDNKYPSKFLKFRLIKTLINEYYTIITACSELDRKIFSSAFNVPQDKIFVTGLPRFDDLLEASKVDSKKSSNQKKINILIAPTFRMESSNYEEDICSLLTAFQDQNLIDFIDVRIRMHPEQVFSDLLYSNIQSKININISEKTSSISDMLWSDLLISDVSSIILDYMLLEKPIYGYFPDHNSFSKLDRGVYDEILITLSDNGFYFSQEELVKKLKNQISKGEFSLNLAILESFHQHKSNFCLRLEKLLCQL